MSVGWMPFVALAVSLSALTLAGTVAIRNRTIFNSRLYFTLRFPVWRTMERKRDFRADAAALIYFGNDVAPTSLHIPIFILNESRRKLSDVVVELTYPRAFYVNSQVFADSKNTFLEHFPHRCDELNSDATLSDRRRATVMEHMVRVNYTVGTLLPGQYRLFSEFIKMPERDVCFSDDRYAKAMFGAILDLLRQDRRIRGICHVAATLYSDLNPPVAKSLDIISFSSALTDDVDLSTLPMAFWLNTPPSGRYFRSAVRRLIHPHFRRRRVDLIEPVFRHDRALAGDEQIAVTEYFDLDRSKLTSAIMRFPGYDHLTLPRSFSVSDALATLGMYKL